MPARRSTRSAGTASARPTRKRQRTAAVKAGDESSEIETESDDADFEQSGEEESEELDSEDLDGDSEEEGAGGKRKRAGSAKGTQKGKGKGTPKSNGKKKNKADDELTASSSSSDEDEDGSAGASTGKAPKAPKAFQAPPGQVSQATLDFLACLTHPLGNDRDWLGRNDGVYRTALKEWNAFVDALVPKAMEADDDLPYLPSRDLVHRLARDIRFSNDRTPYKKNFSASLSRSGRKGVFAGFQPGDKSLIAGGKWGAGKDELAQIRHHLTTDATPFRSTISAPAFVEHFGEPNPGAKGKGKPCNVFGHEGELKVAPKGFDKNHKDIDLLKLRNFVVMYHFKDADVVQPDFADKVAGVIGVMRPFVHLINDLMTTEGPSAQGEEDEGDGEDGEDGEE